MNQNITSIIDNCNIQTAFNRILKYYDPNKAKNRKTRVLDCSSFFSWTEEDYRLFDVTKTRNLYGSIKRNRYDIIVYEPPNNESFFTNAVESSKIFSRIINIGGNIIVKIKNFKSKNDELKGTFDLKTIFESNKFYLHDQIIYKNTPRQNRQNYIKTDSVNAIVHLNFMIFKQKIPT